MSAIYKMPLTKPTDQALRDWLQTRQLGTIDSLQPIAGGCICNNYRLHTDRGERFFLKTLTSGPDSLFECEALGLDAMRSATSLTVPQVYARGPGFLLLEYIEPGQPGAGFWDQLAEGLAAMHERPQPGFGFHTDNFCGETPQPNPRENDGYHFFGQHRLRYQGERAQRAGRMTPKDSEQLERVIERLPDWIPDQAPALLHGDLWGGNIHCDSSGQPVLIDPACYWGWREADIAMTRLFGTLPERFYQRYQQLLPMAPGWEQRMPVYNLYHLLNHVNLFGGAYLSQVRATITQLLNR